MTCAKTKFAPKYRYIYLSHDMTKPTKWLCTQRRLRSACPSNWKRNEPRHDKTNKMSECPVKSQISLGIHLVWSESLLCAEWVDKGPSFLHADSKDSDQTRWMPRLIWVFTGPSLILLVLSCHGSFLFQLLGQERNQHKFEPHHEKTCLRGLRPGKTQTGLCSHRS